MNPIPIGLFIACCLALVFVVGPHLSIDPRPPIVDVLLVLILLAMLGAALATAAMVTTGGEWRQW